MTIERNELNHAKKKENVEKSTYTRAIFLASLRKNKTMKPIEAIAKSIVHSESIKFSKLQILVDRKQLENNERKRGIKKPLAMNVIYKRDAKPIQVKKKPSISDSSSSDCSGNSDDEGSVDSAILDENICYECGKETSHKKYWNKLILCDICDSEYHLKCIGLYLPPRNKFTCHRCQEEESVFHDLDFRVDPKFRLPKSRKSQPKPGICYSPCKPLNIAWHECKKKGFMMVSHVFPYDAMRKLTHGVIEKQTMSGRASEIWRGGTAEISRQCNSLTHNVINRGGRYDIRIPDFVVCALQLEALLEPILARLREIMGSPPPRVRTHNLVFVPVGCPAQAWHCDDTVARGVTHRYFTILIHLNPLDALCGGTEVWEPRLKRGDLIRGRPGDAFVFNGSLLHRGQANAGSTHRLFYYASFACQSDTNTGEV